MLVAILMYFFIGITADAEAQNSFKTYSIANISTQHTKIPSKSCTQNGAQSPLITHSLPNLDKVSANNSHENSEVPKSTDWWLVIVGIAQVLVGAAQAVLFFWQLMLIRKSVKDTYNVAVSSKESADAAKQAANIAARTLVASHRAWVKLNKISISGSLLFDDNGVLNTDIAFDITNIGQSPAIHISCNAWLVVLKNGGPYPFEEQQKRCDEIRKQPIGGGITLFPGERYPDKSGFGKFCIGVNLPPDEIEKALLTNPEHRYLSLSVVGCLDYTFATDPEKHHQTRFIFEVHKKGPIPISPMDKRIEETDLSLFESGIGQGWEAD